MALIEQDRLVNPCELDAVNSIPPADSFPINPHPIDDIVERASLPSFENVVDTNYRVSRDLKHIDGAGTTWIERWRMTDGTIYDILIGEPEKRLVDTAVTSSTQWGARIQGLNEHIAHLVMSSGFPIRFVSTEMKKTLTPDHIGHNMHKIMDTLDERGLQKPKTTVWIGQSKSAMMAFGVVNYAEDNNREVIYSDIHDPCLPIKIDFTNPFEIAQYLHYLPREARRLMRHMGKVSLKELSEIYLPTVGCNLEYFDQVIRGGVPLFSGVYGKMAETMPPDTNMRITFYRDSAPNQYSIYQQLLRRHSDIVIEVDYGYHAQFLNSKALGGMICRLASLGRQLADGVPSNEIDFNRVHWPTIK